MKRRRGFVLLMTVLLIALAATTMATLANRSLQTVARGTLAQHQLQQRWTRMSAQMALLKPASEIFAVRDQELMSRGAGWPYPNELEINVNLAGEPLRIVLRDEQARANLNVLASNPSLALTSEISKAIRLLPTPLRLRPLPRDAYGDALYWAWGQVVPLDSLPTGQDVQDTIAPLSKVFTCWGDGRINLMRADDQAIRLGTREALNALETERLVTERRGYVGPLEGLWTSLEVRRRTQVQLNRIFTKESNCFSMLLSYPGQNRRADCFVVYSPQNRSQSLIRVFHW